MIIAMPVDKDNMETSVGTSFGRTAYFLIYNTDTKESQFINNEAASSRGGAGVKAAQTVVDSKADVLITPQCGENAAEVIKSAGMDIYSSNGSSAKENIDAMIAGDLSSLDNIHGGFHNHG